ncbi:hypothetical protein [Parendozoicomonas sp. Alg238-R29]|uniref:hypothetical protein n=1 Tax=Parendozoicomonas sp. Alg238-R29 TaxID=2993446 RepID=UPI00248D58A2|nr:hypothetical protein [Parendozoicomonas sp. Alg238-R29]
MQYFPVRTLVATVLIALFVSGCLRFPTWPPAPDEDLQATIIYRTLNGERRIATISLTGVTSDKILQQDRNIELQQTNRTLVPLSYRADGIYAESRSKESIRLVSGRNLTDPVLAITPDSDLHVLTYIALQGRKPVLKLRTIYKGTVAEKSFVLPLAGNIDNYLISDFTRQEAP